MLNKQMEMRYYVTLFDSNYLSRGLVMYYSLRKFSENFHLWIVCFDDLAYQILKALKLDCVTLISLQEFEDQDLLKVKSQRTRQEYCWTCTPSVALYVLQNNPQIDSIIYIDADLMFFSSPEPIFGEMGDASILLTEHRYLPYFDQSETSGIYNVQFIFFRRDKNGLEALNWWRERCLEWCFAICESGKFGDQKYLDDWTTRFSGVHVLQHLGAGLAPWNAAQYSLEKKENQIYVNTDLLIFYHFHGLKIYPFNIGFLCGIDYPIQGENQRLIYREYFEEIKRASEGIQLSFPDFNGGVIPFPRVPFHPRSIYHFLKQTFKEIREGRYYYYA